ncbi:unnamed protein product [Sphagnum troendelagicum]|uniref:Uncharacterized protein n=1 Tax=Sphagnum troendelagicum TaxID=128251 RepID=A0ABP0UQ54_9BRYO
MAVAIVFNRSLVCELPERRVTRFGSNGWRCCLSSNSSASLYFVRFGSCLKSACPSACCLSSGSGSLSSFFRGIRVSENSISVRRVSNNSNEHSSPASSCSSCSSTRLLEFAHSSSCGLGSNEWDNSRVSVASCSSSISRRRKRRRKIGVVMALDSWSSRRDFESLSSSSSAAEFVEKEGKLNSIADFTRFRDKGAQGAELQTAIISYRKPLPWSLFQPQQVDLVAAVHIADRVYFSSLQKELSTYDRVLYEMVADKNKMQTNRLGKMRWKPPRRVPGRHGGQGFSIIGTIQRLMAQLLTLEFQLECMDYRQENWYHADLDFDTFQVLQRERGETFFSFAKDLTAISSKAITRAALAPGPHLDPWRAKLLWVSRMVPMPLLGLFVIEGVCAPSDAPLKQVPEMKALLELNPAAAFKVFLAKQITTDLTDGASALVENSVIIGERNRVAMDELQEALRDGCKKVAIFYGSGHLPDMDSRLREQFGLEPIGINWRTAWLIKGRDFNPAGSFSEFLSALAKASGWPLNRYQTLSLLLLSTIFALDLWFWELFLIGCNEYIQKSLIFLVGLLDKGWNL